MGIASILLLFQIPLSAQFAPPAGQAGSTAIKADSSIFVNWADSCTIVRGPIDISNANLGMASYGSDSSAYGIANNGVVSLGDGGIATFYLNTPVVDGPSYDFAVFENSFSDDFLELAFVEVSSNGIDFVRFPSVSNTQTDNQIATFGTIDATKLNNLAGKYRGGYGTAFDLNELQDYDNLDIQNIKYIRVIDVVGNIDDEYASYDSNMNKINDPWPTPFESSGFDLDALGIINDLEHLGLEDDITQELRIYPVPFTNILNIGNIDKNSAISIFDINSRLVYSCKNPETSFTLSGTSLPKGLLILRIENRNSLTYRTILHQ
jgi:hypothetical protein